MPFLANVLRGRPVPPERMEQVAAHYHLFGGRSPINDQSRALLRAMSQAPWAAGRRLYWGNRNWQPYLADTVAEMAADGIGSAAVFVTSAYSSYSGCRQYLEDIAAAVARAGPRAPRLVKLRPYFNHPGFVDPLADGLRASLAGVAGADVVMTAHSIPESAAATCDYQQQLAETARLVAAGAGVDRWRLAFQSRSGPPGQPWLGPDVLELIEELPAGSDLVVCPVGFVSDHMEVMYDLDTQAAELARSRGVRFVRSATPGADGRFVEMVGQLVAEVEDPGAHPPAATGRLGPRPCPCPDGCCPPPSPGRSGPRPSG